MLGERIRNLRKKKKMTLDALAGEKLTKGMLSLIENNKANPSMESLTHIAKQLEVDVTDLLEPISSQELRETLEKAEILFNTKADKIRDKNEQIISLIQPLIPNLTQGYESARLLDIYGRSIHHENNPNWDDILGQAANLYEQLNLTSKRANIGIFRSREKFVAHHYTESLQVFLMERSSIEENHVFIDSITRLDLDYHEAILHFAVGDSVSATRIMENAINYSRDQRIFYRIDDLYRLAAAHAMMTNREEEEAYYLKKLKQYGDFSDDKHSHLFYDLMSIMGLITKERNYTKALELINHYLSDSKMVELEDDKDLLLLYKGEVMYGLGYYKEAISLFNKVKIPSYIHHPFDLSFFYVKDSYKALCHFELKNFDEAIQSAEQAVELFSLLPESPYKDFSNDTYQTIKEEINKQNLL